MTIRALVLLVCVTGASAQTGASIEGTVTDSATHAGVSGADVTLVSDKGAFYTAITDSSGA